MPRSATSPKVIQHEQGGSVASWDQVAKMERMGFPRDQIRREVAAWRKAGWEPQGPFARAVSRAYSSAHAKCPDSVVAGILQPWSDRLGPEVVGIAMTMVHNHWSRG